MSGAYVVRVWVGVVSAQKELVLDVVDRTTRRTIGKCTVPLFRSSARQSPPPNVAADEVETALRHVRRRNALCEIQALECDSDGDNVIGTGCKFATGNL